MSPIDELVPILKKLRLSGALQSLELRVRQSVEDDVHPAEFLLRVLHDEIEQREGKQLEQRLRRAAFELNKTFENFDFLFNPKVPKAKVIDLATCSFVSRKENVLLLGQSGVGKSHIAQALGHRACLAGHEVLYMPAHQLLASMRAARADGSYERRLARLAAVDVLIIDDLGLHPLRHDEPTDLYGLIRVRYEAGAIVITSNRDIEEWPPLFAMRCSPAQPWTACCTTPMSSTSKASRTGTRRANGAHPRQQRSREDQVCRTQGADHLLMPENRRRMDQICRTQGDHICRTLTTERRGSPRKTCGPTRPNHSSVGGARGAKKQKSSLHDPSQHLGRDRDIEAAARHDRRSRSPNRTA
jgi:DNA replication protein DnaC